MEYVLSLLCPALAVSNVKVFSYRIVHAEEAHSEAKSCFDICFENTHPERNENVTNVPEMYEIEDKRCLNLFIFPPRCVRLDRPSQPTVP